MAKFTLDSPVEDLLADETAVKIIEKYAPGTTKNPALILVKKFSLRKLAGIPQAGLSLEMLENLLAEVNAQVKG